MLHQEIFWILTPSSPLSWVSESFRWDIGQFNSPRIKHLSNPFSRFHPRKFFLLKIYLLWKIWPISVKRWKPVWIRAWSGASAALYPGLFAQSELPEEAWNRANFPDKLYRWSHIRNRLGRLGTRLGHLLIEIRGTRRQENIAENFLLLESGQILLDDPSIHVQFSRLIF